MAASAEDALAALREAKFKKWQQRKSVRDRVLQLLSELSVARAEDTESVKEVCIAMCAAAFLLGEDDSKKSSEPAAKAPQKTLKQVMYKWVMDHHAFNMVKVTPAEVAKFSGAVKEMLNKEKNEETGEEYDVLLTLRYFFPGVPKPNEKPKPLSNDQTLQNVIFAREFSKLWRWCKEETKNRAVEYAARAAAKRRGSMGGGEGKESDEAKEGEGKARAEEEGAKRASSGSSAAALSHFGGDDGATFSRSEVVALQELSINRLKFWIEEDEDEEVRAKKESEESSASQAKKLHEQFVKVKDSLRIRMPPASIVKAEFEKPPKFGYGRELDGVKPKTFKGPQSTVDMMAGSGLKWVHATNKGRQGMEGDLERSRKQLLEKGFVDKGNFDPDSADDFRRELRSNEKLRERRDNEVRLKEASAKAFNEWVQQKDLREQAVKCLEHIGGSSSGGAANSSGNASAAGSVRGSREGSVGGGSRSASPGPGTAGLGGVASTAGGKSSGNTLSVGELIEIGKALKKVDRTLLTEWSAACSHAINFNNCAILWDCFAPIACDVHNTAYSAVRDSFIKLLRPGVDYKAVFKDVVRRKVMQATGNDISDMAEDDRKAAAEEMALSKTDMAKVMKLLGIAMKPGELRVLIDAFDENGDGVITLNEFMNFVGPKRDKRGGSSLSLNQKCCWGTTCKLTGMANAFSISAIDRRSALAKKKILEGAAHGHARTHAHGGSREGSLKEAADGDAFEGGSAVSKTGAFEILELNNGEYRIRVELRERKRREDLLRKFGVISGSGAGLAGKSGGKHGGDGDYEDDFASPNPDAEAEYEDEGFADADGNDAEDSKAGDKSKGADKNRCAFVTWTMQQRLQGLQWLYEYTRVAREEAELQKVLTSGKPPKQVELLSAAFGDRDVGNAPDALCTELLLKWRPAASSGSDLVSFFSVEMGGQAGAGKETSFTEIYRDPPDASADMGYQHWVRGLLPGASYNFRIRAFNGYGPSEYTYRIFTTRPSMPTTPRVIYLSSDAVTLRWIFSKGFNKRMAELRRIFDAADADKSGNVNRQELAAVIDEIFSEDEDDNADSNKIVGSELRNFLKSIAADNGINPGEGYAALFDKIEGDDDEDISWEEFQRFFLNNGWVNSANEQVKGGSTHNMNMSSSAVTASMQGGSTAGGGTGKIAGSTKAVKLSYIIEQCENELDNTYREALRTTSITGKASLKHLEAGKSYRYRVVAVNADGVQGPPSESIVVHTLIETPPAPVVHSTSLSASGAGATAALSATARGSGDSATPAIRKYLIDASKVTIGWKDRNAAIFANSRDKKFVNRMLGDWTGSQGAGEAGAKSVSIEAAFAYYDRDGNGSIDPTEFALLLEDLGVEPTPDRLTHAFSQLDTDHSGAISFEEFSVWWRSASIAYTLKRSERLQPRRAGAGAGAAAAGGKGGANAQFLPLRPRQATYPVIPYRIGPATRTEVAGLQPNSLYQFVLRYVGSRSLSLLSPPAVVMTAPLPPQPPVLLLASSNSMRVKMYPQRGGVFKYLVQMKQKGSTSSGGAASTTIPLQFALPTTPVTAPIDCDGWHSVYFGQETTYSCVTLASETDYSVRVFGVNYQNTLSAPSPETSFRTTKRAKHQVSAGEIAANEAAAAKQLMATTGAAGRRSANGSTAGRPGSASATGRNATIAGIVKNHPLAASGADSLAGHSAGGRTLRASNNRGLFVDSRFSVECRFDISVGDSILFTERLYLKQPQPGHRGGGVTAAVDDDIASVAGSGSVKSTRVVNGKKVVRLDMSQRGRGDDDGRTDGTTLGGVTVHAAHSSSNIMIGERTIAAHVVRDNYRTLLHSGQLDNKFHSAAQASASATATSATAIDYNVVSLDALEKRKAKLIKGRVLSLEVIWSRVSNPEECKRYEYKAGEVIERAQDLHSMLSFDVYRCEWQHEDRRLSYEAERELLRDCFLEYD